MPADTRRLAGGSTDRRSATTRRGNDTRILSTTARPVRFEAVVVDDGHAHAQQFGTQAAGANLLAPLDGNVNTIDDPVARLKTLAIRRGHRDLR
jgi:hypothetical protein